MLRVERTVQVFEFGLKWYPKCSETMFFRLHSGTRTSWVELILNLGSSCCLGLKFSERIVSVYNMSRISLNLYSTILLCFTVFLFWTKFLGVLSKSGGGLSYLVTTDFTFVSSESRVSLRVCDVLSVLTSVWVTLFLRI